MCYSVCLRRRYVHRKRAFFHIQAAGEDVGRVEVELADDVLPVTCQNFLQLCAGSAAKPDGTLITYKVSVDEVPI